MACPKMRSPKKQFLVSLTSPWKHIGDLGFALYMTSPHSRLQIWSPVLDPWFQGDSALWINVEKKTPWTAETFSARFKRPKLPVSGIRKFETVSFKVWISHSRVMKKNHSTKCVHLSFPTLNTFWAPKKKTKSWEPGEDCPSSKLPLSWKLPAKPLTNTAKVGNIGMLASGPLLGWDFVGVHQDQVRWESWVWISRTKDSKWEKRNTQIYHNIP